MANQTLSNANEILVNATPEQVKWVYARLTAKTDKEAAKEAGVHPTTVSRWDTKDELDRAVFLLLQEPRQAALDILEASVIEAAKIKVEGLRKGLKQAAASEILDRVLGRPTQRQEVTGKEGSQLVIRVLGNVDLDAV